MHILKQNAQQKMLLSEVKLILILKDSIHFRRHQCQNPITD